jgi:hypothetical protein
MSTLGFDRMDLTSVQVISPKDDVAMFDKRRQATGTHHLQRDEAFGNIIA